MKKSSIALSAENSHEGINVGQVKLSCRKIWKVFGDSPNQFFSDNNKMRTTDRISKIIEKGHIPAVSDVSFDVMEGEIFVLMGLSGSGKSTVLRCLSSLVGPTSGEIVFEGRSMLELSRAELIDMRRHKMGMVFQSFGLLPHLTVIENIAFPLKIQGVGVAERNQRAQKFIVLVGLEGREHAMPDELSGGQQQRVGIARSLAVGPDLWFLDEPFSALDPLIRRQMQDEFVRLQSKLNKTIVFVTHDFLEALKIADRIAIMKDGQLVQIGTPSEIVLHPADNYVSEFTADVPLVRVLTARDMVDNSLSKTKPVGEVAPELTLEELLKFHDFATGDLQVKDDGGEILGRISAQNVMHALHEGIAKRGSGVS